MTSTETQSQSQVAMSQFKPGYPVAHSKFGKGTVVRVEADKLTIRFKTVGTKVVLDSYVKLT